MTLLVGRTKEQQQLQALFQQEQATFAAVYGRRRVGKTYLINTYFQGKGLLFELMGSKGASKKDQLRNFHRELVTQFPGAPSVAPQHWNEAFEQLNKAIHSLDEKQKIILFFDELPWLASPRSGFLPTLEYFWNRHFSRRKNLLVIICGSAAAWMIKRVVNNKEGLYGRLHCILPIAPFTLKEMEALLQAKNIELPRKSLVDLFLVTGGVGAYCEHIQGGLSAVDTINQLCFKPNGPLFLEFNNLFHSLFNSPEKHIQIVKALANKRRGYTQKALLKAVNLPQSGRSTEVLEELEACGFITSLPLYGSHRREKKVMLYDEYSYFYLTWVHPEYQAILRGSDPQHWHKIFTSAAWITWAGFAFENVCLKHIYNIKYALGITGVKTKESYWRYIPPKGSEEQGGEIDLIIERADHCIHLCEIKFSEHAFVIDKDYAKKLIHRRELFREQTKTKKALFITFITPYGVKQNSYYKEIVHSEVTLDHFFA